MPSVVDSRKRPAHLGLDAKVPDMAQALGMDLSQTVDELLAAEVQRRYWARRNDDNREAIGAYNARTESEGLPLAAYRSFARGE